MNNIAKEGAVFYLDDILVDSIKGTVTIDGVEKRPPHRSIKILCVLAEAPGKTIDKRTVMDSVWSDTIVSNEAMTKAINILRNLVEADPKSPKIIQTVRGQGYKLLVTPRFVGQFEAAEESVAPIVTKPKEKLSWLQKLKHNTLFSTKAFRWTLVSSLALVIAVTTRVLLGSGAEHSQALKVVYNPSAPANMLAVEQGIAANLKQQLHQSLNTYLKGALIVEGAGSDNNFDYRIDTQVSFNQNLVEYSAKLWSTTDDDYVWEKTVSLPYAQSLAISDDIAKDLLNKMHVELIESDLVQGDYLSQYQSAKENFLKGTEVTLLTALEEVEQSLARNQEYADAHALKVAILVYLKSYERHSVLTSDYIVQRHHKVAKNLEPHSSMVLFVDGLMDFHNADLDRAIPKLTRALDLDKENYHALETLSSIYFKENRIGDLEQLIAGIPGSHPLFEDAAFLKAKLLAYKGDLSAALKLVDHLDEETSRTPKDKIRRQKSYWYNQYYQFEKATEASLQATAVNQANPENINSVLMSHISTENYVAIEQVINSTPNIMDDPDLRFTVLMYYARSKRFKEISLVENRRILAGKENSPKEDFFFQLARIYQGNDSKSQSWQELLQAYGSLDNTDTKIYLTQVLLTAIEDMREQSVANKELSEMLAELKERESLGFNMPRERALVAKLEVVVKAA